MIRKAMIVVLTLAALTTGVAWSGTYMFPLAVLQVLGLADSGSLYGVRWEAEWNVWEGNTATHSLDIRIKHDLIGLSWYTHYVQPQFPTVRQRWERGAVKYWHFLQTYAPSPAGPPRLYKAVRLLRIDLPLLPVWILLAVYPMIALIRPRLRRWRRLQEGLCLKCGYDLRGNVSHVCPECGRAM